VVSNVIGGIRMLLGMLFMGMILALEVGSGHFMIGLMVLMLVIWHSLSFGLSLPDSFSLPTLLLPPLTLLLVAPQFKDKVVFWVNGVVTKCWLGSVGLEVNWRRITGKTRKSSLPFHVMFLITNHSLFSILNCFI